MSAPQPWVGRSRPAVDAGAIVTGEVEFVTDLHPAGVLHGAVLRSHLPHARIERIDVTAARALDGVHCVLTGADVPVNALGPRDVDGPALADTVVRQVGEAIALIAAVDEATALRAMAAIELELTPLPVVDGPQAAAAPDAPQLHATGNVSARIAFSSGDVEAAIAPAALVLRRDVTTPSQEHVAIDTPGGVAVVEDGGTVTIWCGSQNPGLHQRKVARALGVEVADVRMIANPVGGAFGSRNDDPMPVFLALLARATGRPVRVHMTREETMAAGAKRHPFWTSIAIGFDAAGRILGSSVQAVADTGPVITSGPNVMKTSAEMSTGPYRFPVASFDGTVYYTNNANAGAFRGYGVPQVAFAIENAITEAAHTLGLDPMQMRIDNALRGGEQHSLYRHKVTDGLAARATLEQAARHPIWTEREQWKAGAPWPWRRGIGVATAIKGVGMGSGTGDAARARLQIDGDGFVTIWAGPNHTGQSIQTTYGQVAADVLQIPIEQIDVRIGDTGVVPESGPTAASRSTYAGGNAVRMVCEELVRRCAELELPLRTDAGSAGTKLVELGEAVVEQTFVLPDTDDIGLVPPEDLAKYGPHRVYGASTQVVRLELNPLTGEIRVPELLCVVDCGTAINPAAMIGQAEGGILQGLGLAIMEEHRLEGGVPITTSLENYLIPTIADTPVMHVEMVDGFEDSGPFGAKGMSEVVVVPTPPAVAAAVMDAVGVLPNVLPLTPERVLDLLEEAS